MSSPEEGRSALAAVAISLCKCHEDTPVSPESLVALTKAFIRYHHIQTQKWENIEKVLTSPAWDYTKELGEALRPIINSYTAYCSKQRASEQRLSALLDTSACLAIFTSGHQSAGDERNVLSEILRGQTEELVKTLEDMLGCKPQSRKSIFSILLAQYMTPLKISPWLAEAQPRLNCLLRCLEDTKRYAARVSVISDLRNAFRAQFYERRTESGLSSLDRLNLTLRTNLFFSHYSILVRRDRSASIPGMGQPFYPYISLVQSSGSGKSRLLFEVGQTLPLVYGNLNAADSKGYPLPNKSLRNFLLWQDNAVLWGAEASTEQCEERCETLLLVTLIAFYLLFSSRDDRRKKVIMPREDLLRRNVEERSWQTIGICDLEDELDGELLQSPGDLFWDVVITITERLIHTKRRRNTSGSKKNATDRLLELERLLRQFGETMLSARGANQSMTDIRETSENLTPEAIKGRDPQLTTVPESWSNAQRYDSRHESREKVMDLLQGYLDLRMITIKESLSEIAKSLQQLNSQESQDVTDSHGLCALFVAFDESHCLTTCTVKNNSVLRGEKERDSTVSVFRCLRTVLRKMYRNHGVSMFMVFTDTVPKHANFVPQRSRDPSARMMHDAGFREYPGQVFSPFIALGTESTGVMLAEADTFDFPQRLKSFCARWGLPKVESSRESVTEDITSFPCELLKEQCRANRTLHTSARKEDEVIFRSDEDYVYLGRPLWASAMKHKQKGASWLHMVMFAVKRLLGGNGFLSEDRSIYGKQSLAALGCRLPLQFVEYRGIAPQLIAEHMAWCTNVSWDRDCVYLRYINEPLLATAAAVLWDKELAGMLECLVARCGTYVSSKGDLGEVAVCVLLILAVDGAYKSRNRTMEGEKSSLFTSDMSEGNDGYTASPAKLQYEDELRRIPKGLTMFGVVTVKEFLESGFTLRVETLFKCGSLMPIEDLTLRDPAGYAWIPKAGASDMPVSRSESTIFVPELLAAAQVRFKSIKRVAASVGCRDIPFLFEANVAVLAHRKQKGIDIMIPLRIRVPCPNDNYETKWTCLTIQVNKRRRSARVSTVVGRHLDPKCTQAVHCDISEGKDCDRCKWMKENHFGIALNVYDGAKPENERVLGPLWSYISSHAMSGDVDIMKNNKGSPDDIIRKKRKLGVVPGDEEGVTSVDEPRSANLIINGLCGEAGCDPRVRCSSGILYQLKCLVAQDSLSGIINGTAQQDLDAVHNLLASASGEDEYNFKMLEESVNVWTGITRDLEKSLARQN